MRIIIRFRTKNKHKSFELLFLFFFDRTRLDSSEESHQGNDTINDWAEVGLYYAAFFGVQVSYQVHIFCFQTPRTGLAMLVYSLYNTISTPASLDIGGRGGNHVMNISMLKI